MDTGQIDFTKQGAQGEALPVSRKILEGTMGRGILLWLLGVPIPIIILLALIWH
jgi:hypothetical protein